jgi:hypothetical protein
MSRIAPTATSGATPIAMNRKPVYRWKYGTLCSMWSVNKFKGRGMIMRAEIKAMTLIKGLF